ncbi:UDP-N-acetylmuramate dehydrogenase [Candidatus Gottesmanbacteria bacterium]|nr:UDP-N-acetylmuramate dehydrogenase [Candidatus Gottesmanbacteria bacterium]
MNASYNKLSKLLGETRVLKNIPLSKYSSYRIGGPADLFFQAKTEKELIHAVNLARQLNIPYFIIGGGTNLLISDNGIRGLVIKNESNAIKLVGIRGIRKGDKTKNFSTYGDTVYLEVESGVLINRLVRFTLEQGMAGLEIFLGQPGSIGGAVYMNAHNIKTGSYFGDLIIEAKLLDHSGLIKKVPRSYFHFAYDQSIIQQTKEIVLTVVFQLKVGNKDSLWQKATQILEYRKKTQPTGVYSSGCVFKNIQKSEAVRLATPNYTCSAGYLLESAGLKGVGCKGAYFSKDHGNFIINKGDAGAQDVVKLIRMAKVRVKKKYNIDLVEEIILAGDF